MYAAQFARKYQHVTRDTAAATGDAEQIYETEEGPAIVLVAGNSVLTLEGFELPLARKLELSILASEPNSELRVAATAAPPAVTATVNVPGAITVAEVMA